MRESDDVLLSLEEAVAKFGISRTTIYRAEAAGELRLIRQRRGRIRVRVRTGDLRRLVEPTQKNVRRPAKTSRDAPEATQMMASRGRGRPSK